MKETDNKVFGLSDEELAKVVGGQTDRNTETEKPDPLRSLDAPLDNSFPSTIEHCDLEYIPDWECTRAPIKEQR